MIALLRKSLPWLVLALLLGTQNASAGSTNADATQGESLSVITSNRPLALLAQEILGQQGSASSLLEPGQTPHDFSLSFSDRHRLSKANLIVWIGADIEPFLDKLVSNHSGHNLRLDSLFSLDTAHDEHHGHDEHQHESDFHLWMSPADAITIARALHRQLRQLAPNQADQLTQNLTTLEQNIRSVDAEIAKQLQGLQGNYGIAHNAYSHFIEHYGLPEPLLLSHSTETSPGVRQYMKIQDQLPEGSCVLVEPEHALGWPKQLSDREGYRLTLVDSLASRKDYRNYSDWISTVADQFEQCLNPGANH